MEQIIILNKMKKILISILLFTSLANAQTFSQISDLINNNLANSSKITASKHREVEFALLNYIQLNLPQKGDIKAIKCDTTYLNENFETNGLGKNLRLGWAICNGNNGTDNITGRTIIGHGLGYSVLSGTGGSKDAVVVEHSHGLPVEGGGSLNIQSIVTSPNNDEGFSETNRTTVTGVSGIDRNMQPYIIQLYIMKL